MIVLTVGIEFANVPAVLRSICGDGAGAVILTQAGSRLMIGTRQVPDMRRLHPIWRWP
jgi:3-oxoacyl-[acyl-carrier-protein] synthase III